MLRLLISRLILVDLVLLGVLNLVLGRVGQLGMLVVLVEDLLGLHGGLEQGREELQQAGLGDGGGGGWGCWSGCSSWR